MITQYATYYPIHRGENLAILITIMAPIFLLGSCSSMHVRLHEENQALRSIAPTSNVDAESLSTRINMGSRAEIVNELRPITPLILTENQIIRSNRRKIAVMTVMITGISLTSLSLSLVVSVLFLWDSIPMPYYQKTVISLFGGFGVILGLGLMYELRKVAPPARVFPQL